MVAGPGSSDGAGAAAAAQPLRQSDDAVEAGPVVMDVDSTGAQVIRQTTVDVAADADSHGGV